MKNLFLKLSILILVFLLINTQSTFSQVLISGSSGTPDGSAMLEIKSDNKGVLIPRVTTANRQGISGTAGLIVYDTNIGSFFLYGKKPDATMGWVDLSSNAEIWQIEDTTVFLSNSNYNVGIGTSNPTKKFVLKADNSTDTLFEIQDQNGNPLMVITPSLTKFNIIKSAKGISGGFAVGRYEAAKTISDTTLFIVTPDSTRVYTSAKSTGISGGFAVGRYEAAKGSKAKRPRSYMYMVPNNYFIGDQSGDSLQTGKYSGKYNTFFGYQTGLNDTVGGSNVFIGYKSGLNNVGQVTVAHDSLGFRNVFLGYEAGYNNTLGSDNVLLGYQAGYSNTTKSNNVLIGSSAGANNQNSEENVFLGNKAGQGYAINNSLSRFNVVLGASAGENLNGADDNVFIGHNAGLGDVAGVTGADNVIIGEGSGNKIKNASRNIFIGKIAGADITNSEDNVFLGTGAGRFQTSGDDNTYIGNNAGMGSGTTPNTGYANVCIGYNAGKNNTTGFHNIFMGYVAGSFNTTGRQNVFIGRLTGVGTAANPVTGAGNVAVGNLAGNELSTGAGNVFMGFQAGKKNRYGSNNIFLGSSAGFENLGSSSNASRGSGNVFLGNSSGYDNETGSGNVFLGQNSGHANFNADNNVFIGNSAGHNNYNADNNVFIGNNAGQQNLNSESNIFIGNYAGQFHEGTSSTALHNIFIGEYAGRATFGDKGNGTSNIAIGFEAGNKITTGDYNIFMGESAGKGNETGSKNIFLGYQAGMAEIGSNKLYIDNSASTTPLIYGDFNANNLKFNSNLEIIDNNSGSAPTLKLIETQANVGARIKFTNSAETDNYWTVYSRADNTDNDSRFNIYHHNGTNGTNVVVITGSRNFGIKRTPLTNDLEVNGTASKSSAGGWLSNSDRRIKTNILDIENAKETLLKLHPVKFKYTEEWKKREPSLKDFYYYNYIAQEFKEVFPNSVKGSGEYLEGDDVEILQIDTYNAQIITTKAVQELIIENKTMNNKINRLEKQIQELKQLIQNK